MNNSDISYENKPEYDILLMRLLSLSATMISPDEVTATAAG
jgi:hypothetical protein